MSEPAEQVAEELQTLEYFPEPVIALIKEEAYRRIKKGAVYVCERGHRTKGKDLSVVVEISDENVVSAELICPECDSNKLMIPQPILVIDTNVNER